MSTHIWSTPPAGPPLRLYSCVLCRQRRVKCDKQQPCSNCTRAHAECVRTVPAPPRRRKEKAKPVEEDLSCRLRRYEALLKAYGAKFVEMEAQDVESPLSDNASFTPKTDSNRGQTFVPSDKASSMHSGRAKHLENNHRNLWTTLSDEILESQSDEENAHSSLGDPMVLPIVEAGRFVFEPCPHDASLTHFHPPTVQIYSLWQTFLDNVNPLVKVIHVPTVQRRILEASVYIEQVSRPMEALMFAIYLCSITSLDNEECGRLSGQSRATLLAKYRKVTQQALMRAGFFSTLDVVVLQAATLFLMSIRADNDPGEFWILAGIALRIGQRIGLNRVCGSASLGVLDNEINRRLWWQIIVLDAHSADRSGAGGADVMRWDIALPLNVNDSDLTPAMTGPPSDHLGATEMVFCLMMYEIGTFLRHSTSMAVFDGSWQKLTSHTVPLSNKDQVIDELEEIIERKYLRFCDPVIPLHIAAASMAKMIIGRMRLTTRHPRQYPDRGSGMLQEEKVKLFSICLMLIEQDNFNHSTPCIHNFLWRFDHHIELDAFVYLLSELQRQGNGPLADKAWLQIAEAFVHHPEMVSNATNPLHAAIGNLTLRSWEVRAAEYRRHHRSPPEGSLPVFISNLRSQRLKVVSDTSDQTPLDHEVELGESGIACEKHNTFLENSDGQFDSSMMPDMDWNYWDDLMLRGGGDLT